MWLIVLSTIAIAVITWVIAGFYLSGSSGVRESGARRVAGAAAPTSRKQANADVCVLYGTQTGTAEMFAKTLTREGLRLGVPMRFIDVENYRPSDISGEKCAIIVCATYGDGEPTDSMLAFHEWLMDESRTAGEELKQLKYAVFGLGDRQYLNFCREGVTVDRRLSELGARRIYPLGRGDSSSGIEEEFDRWRRGLWPVLSDELAVDLKSVADEPVVPECLLKMWDASEEAPLPFPKLASVLEPTQRLPSWVPVKANEELLRVTDGRSTRLVELDISDTVISYQAGDHLGVLPSNTDEVVDAYLRALSVSEEDSRQVISLQNKATGKNVFPCRVSIRTAFKWYVDLAGAPKKSTLRAFVHFCSDPNEKSALLELLSTEPASAQKFSRLAAELRTVLGFLERFRSMSPPLELFLEMMPQIVPRYFSISSDSLSHPKSVMITVAVVDDGLCTNMLQRAGVGEGIPVFVRKSNFHLPLRAKERPIVMIGPGTGVAPFIGFLHRRSAWLKKGSKIGEAMLFFGCRRRGEDHIYADFTAECLANGTLSVLDVAYSREQPGKVYVQHRLAARGGKVWEVIREGGGIYVCGDARNMARDVEAQLLQILQEHGSMDQAEAATFLEKLAAEERYLKDVWTA